MGLRKLLRKLPVIAVALAALFCLGTAPAGASTLVLKIRNDGTGLCLAGQRNLPILYDYVVQVDCSTPYRTVWDVEFVGAWYGNWYRLRHHDDPSLCVTAPSAAGEKNHLAICETDPNHPYYDLQVWGFIPVPEMNNQQHVINLATSNGLAIPGGSTAQGVASITWPCGNWADHFWRGVV